MSESIKIGRMEQVYCATFMAKNDEIVEINVPLKPGQEIGQSYINLEIVFKERAGDPGGDFMATSNGVRFTFEGWHTPLGAVTDSPLKFGNVESRKMYLSMRNQYIGQVNVCTVAILLGAQNE